MDNNFPEWLRSRLTEHRMSQAELAKRSGISPAQITRALNGERGLGEQSIVAIAKAMHLAPEEVFLASVGLQPSKGDDPKVNEIAHLASLLSEDYKDLAIGMLRTLVMQYEDRSKPANKNIERVQNKTK